MIRARNEDLKKRIDALPRAKIARLPTPLDELPNLSRELGIRLLFKREDMTGLAFGGNKTRELDFFIGDAMAQDADVFIAGGGAAQSNHAVQCSAAARKAGMKPVMVLHQYCAGEIQGNLLLNHLIGVDLRLVETGSVDSAITQRIALRQKMDAVADEYRRKGHKPYILPSSFHVLGAVGYVDCIRELQIQLDAQDIDVDYIYLTSAGATQVGLVLGAKYMCCRFPVIGINYALATDNLALRLAELGNQTAALLGLETRLNTNDLPNESFAGDGYGKVSHSGNDAIRLLARTEGLFVDPVYSGKGLAGLIEHVRTGRIGHGKTVVFVHTGGLLVLFSYNLDVLGDHDRSAKKD